MSLPITIIGYIDAVTIAGGLCMVVWSTVRRWRSGRGPRRLSQGRPERRLVASSNLACLVGTAFRLHSSLVPAPASPSAELAVTTYEANNTTIKEILVGDRAREWQNRHREGIIALFAIPSIITLLPWLLFALDIRPAIEAIPASLLAAQAMIGMSGHGLVFIPSALLMLMAAIAATRLVDSGRAAAGFGTDFN